MKSKKLIVIFASFILSCIFAYVIGQKFVVPLRHKEVVDENKETADSFVKLSFEGSQETSDNPWNTTAGWIDTEEDGRCIFLTPNTATFFEITGVETLSFDCEIHPWVKASSDGAGILVWVMDNEDTILYQEEIFVDAKDSWKKVELDLRPYKSVEKIKILCNNGKNEDDNGDWVLVKFSETEGKEVSLQNTTANKSEKEDFVIFSAYGMSTSDNLIKNNAIAGKGALEYPVLLTEEEAWDSVDVLNPSVLLVNGIYYNYYSGWDGSIWRTGLATSIDGINWEKNSKNPILDIRKGKWDNDYIAANGSAILFQNKIYYFYQGMTEGTKEAQIGLAISENGEDFIERTNVPVLSVGENGQWDCASVADPYVININGTLYMYYLGQDELGVQRLGVAKSRDGKKWIKYVNNPIIDVGVVGAFDENGLGEPSVIYQVPYFYMIYTGRNSVEQRNLGLAVSLDGVNWKKLNYEGLFELSQNIWDNQVMCDPTLLENDNGDVTVWYGGGNIPSPDENLNGRIGMFTISLDNVIDTTQFNANSDWENSFINSVDFLKGSYEVEGSEPNKYVWCSDEITIVLDNNADAEQLKIQGYLPMDLHQKVQRKEVKLSFYFNGELVEEKIFSKEELFEIELNKPSGLENEIRYLELQIKASSVVNAKDYQIFEDERNLSYILYAISQE